MHWRSPCADSVSIERCNSQAGYGRRNLFCHILMCHSLLDAVYPFSLSHTRVAFGGGQTYYAFTATHSYRPTSWLFVMSIITPPAVIPSCTQLVLACVDIAIEASRPELVSLAQPRFLHDRSTHRPALAVHAVLPIDSKLLCNSWATCAYLWHGVTGRPSFRLCRLVGKCRIVLQNPRTSTVVLYKR